MVADNDNHLRGFWLLPWTLQLLQHHTVPAACQSLPELLLIAAQSFPAGCGACGNPRCSVALRGGQENKHSGSTVGGRDGTASAGMA
jgi:hypothetical protein